MKFLSLATALLGIAAVASSVVAETPAKRLVDVSETTMDVQEVQKSNADTFVVTVQRTDDLMADDGTFLAERVMSVAFNFDVQNHEIFLNDVAVPCHQSEDDQDLAEPIKATVEVKAGLGVGPALDLETTTMDDLMQAFDQGLVKVEVTATTEFLKAEDGSTVRRVTLQETIVEINGEEMVQTEAAQQVIEILADGTLGSITPLESLFEQEENEGGCAQNFEEAMKALEDWAEDLDWPVFLGFVALALACFGLSVHSVRALVLKRRQARYAQLEQVDEAAEGLVSEEEKKEFKEKN